MYDAEFKKKKIASPFLTKARTFTPAINNRTRGLQRVLLLVTKYMDSPKMERGNPILCGISVHSQAPNLV